METKKLMTYAFMALSMAAVTTSCSDDDDSNGSSTTVKPADAQFIVVSGDPVSDLTGGVYMKTYTDLTTNKDGQSVYGTADAVKSYDSFTQETYNPQSGVLTGYIYARGASAEGLGSLQAGLRSYKLVNGVMTEIAQPVLLDNFGNTGTFGTYSYAAQISNPVVVVVDENGTGSTVTIDPTKYAIDGTNPAISNIVDMGNNQVAMVWTYANRDSAVVAFADYNLNVSKVIYTDRIGTSVGAQRSVRYSQSGADDNGNVYVFCGGSSSDDNKVGALRIKKGTTEFDPDYKFDIFTKSGGYRFRKAYHISGDYFLIEFYNEADKHGNMDASGKMAVVNMTAQTLTWVTGLPDMTTVSIAWGDGLDGNYYLPLAASTSFGGGSGSGSGSGRPSYAASTTTTQTVPTIYKINAATGVATPFMTFATTDLLKAIRIIK